MRKEIKTYIEAELRFYHQTKKDLEEAKDDIRDAGVSEDNMGIRGSSISNVVESKSLRLITNKRIKKLEETIRSIDIVIGELDEHKYKLVELKYWTRPKLLSDMGIAKELNIDRATLYRWIDGILIAIAIELGLVEEPSLRQSCDI
ncbi:hypothetical protein [Anaerovirgula multivorans]|uniref:hypothetical protein n=1 Tax=Anaerovirgula multivorans TaxID=312168 RepID=UPI00159502BC|nr:hypothetical protein [Anaerovirgula multivorans]